MRSKHVAKVGNLHEWSLKLLVLNRPAIQKQFCLSQSGFLNQWAIGDFAVGHRAIRKVGCLVQKSVISVIPQCADFFFGDQGKNRSPRGEDLFFEIRAITGQTTLTRKWRPFFRGGGPQSNGPCKLSKNTK